ncbi:trypsin-like serine peptidase [Staphylococcus debuckii]|uniref:trypsin-like serine peptidase n=1 Tax=Staphylococcus debuckii TaxID=2044912 RepID=UPI000F42D3B5|nr:serine protease [Staphylococcus debuckii]AYU54488.1 serine protease [Staphylococcus debuckii]
MKVKGLKAGIVTVCAVVGLSFSGAGGEEAHAAGSYYYNGMSNYNESTAYPKAKKISNSNLDIHHISNTMKTKYKAVGRVSNKDGWKGRGKDSMGTGTVIGNYTLVTNAHVIDTAKGAAANPKYITFDMARDGSRKPYTFHATKVVKVPNTDVALVYTKEKMSKYATPLKLASNAQINGLKYNTKLYSVGYPWQNGDNTKTHWSSFRFIQRSSNGTELQTKDKFRAGASGSPMVNGNYQIFGLRTYGYNLWANSTTNYAKVEMAGGEAMNGATGNFVRTHIK